MDKPALWITPFTHGSGAVIRMAGAVMRKARSSFPNPGLSNESTEQRVNRAPTGANECPCQLAALELAAGAGEAAGADAAGDGDEDAVEDELTELLDEERLSVR
ncbi:hypothetical protein P3T39_004914 [Kitasatospora sp. GP82]|nr:hypothetical protein [Kitasatospora sp. GP82]